jgi:flagellar motility protein MotE (MotC chaperone)
MWKISPPRLLPATIAALAALLVVKSAIIMQAVATHGAKSDSVMVNVAKAASTERSPESAPRPAADKAKPTAGASPAAPAPALAEQKPDPSTPPSDAQQPVSESERALLQELRERRKELDARADAIALRESVMTAAEHKLEGRLTELQTLQKKLESLDTAQKQKEEAGWQGLVKVYENMKPKDAAAIFNDLQMPVLLQVLDRMKEAKAAAIMAAMNPDKARDVTAQLAQMRTGKDAAQQGPASQAASTGG